MTREQREQYLIDRGHGLLMAQIRNAVMDAVEHDITRSWATLNLFTETDPERSRRVCDVDDGTFELLEDGIRCTTIDG